MNQICFNHQGLELANTISQTVTEMEQLQFEYADNPNVQIELGILSKHKNILLEVLGQFSLILKDEMPLDTANKSAS